MSIPLEDTLLPKKSVREKKWFNIRGGGLIILSLTGE
jgi:hypothetical protein